MCKSLQIVIDGNGIAEIGVAFQIKLILFNGFKQIYVNLFVLPHQRMI